MSRRRADVLKLAVSLSGLSAAIMLGPVAYLGVTAKMIKLCLTAQLPCLIVAHLIALRIMFRKEVVKLAELIQRFMYGWFIGTGLWHATFVIYGAPVVDDLLSTLCAAALSAVFTAAPLSCVVGTNPFDWLAYVWDDIKFTTDRAQRLLKFGVFGVVTGLSCSAAVIPLDWDRPWQEWPCPAVVGASCGYSGSLAVFAAVEALSMMLKKDRVI